MFITMHCMGMPFNGATIGHKSLGGSETAAYYLARELARIGHKVTLFTNCQSEGIFEGVRYCWAGNIAPSTPLGDRFHYYASVTPCDVLIIQRHDEAFRFRWASKRNVWWCHDLAIVRRAAKVNQMMWNIDQVWVVSEFHKEQFSRVYGIKKDIIKVQRNGIDLSLFSGEISNKSPSLGDGLNMTYSSRPERGLEWLVKPGGIMEQLIDKLPTAHLYVCGYDHTVPEMRPFYEYVWGRIEELPNCTNLGPLTKRQLADVMKQADLHVYPTPGEANPNFEEVSCITAMECMAAGLPFLSTTAGALPETCKDSGCVLLPLKDGIPDLDAFVREIVDIASSETRRERLIDMQIMAASRNDWSAEPRKCVEENLAYFPVPEVHDVAEHLMHTSDIYALRHLLGRESGNAIIEAKRKELEECYSFMLTPEPWEKHYADYYEREKEKGVKYGPEDLHGNKRFESVRAILSDHLDGVGGKPVVLDYGCAHGHYVNNLAPHFKDCLFIGIDIDRSNIETARKWAEDACLDNVEFHIGRVENGKLTADVPLADVIIAAEVIEHVGDYVGLINSLLAHLKPGGLFIATTPYGPWEAIGYKKEWPWRAHVHHFERADLHEMLEDMDFEIELVNEGHAFGEPIGSYLWYFRNNGKAVKHYNIERKLSQVVPARQTVSLCMIVKNAQETILKTLKSAIPHVDELVVGLDNTTTDSTREMIEEWMAANYPEKPIQIFEIESPILTGFDQARNATIEKASGTWILWMDADEEILFKPESTRLLRNNQYDSYMIDQIHVALDPAGVLKVDKPARLFRRSSGLRFYGRVHEHPEIELNKGPGQTVPIQDIRILHPAYVDEPTRQRRFWRNLPLLERDRQDYPERLLGKFLLLRDLSQMCAVDIQHGSGITADMKERAQAGMKLFEDLLDAEEVSSQMLVESLSFYSPLSQILGEGFEVGMVISTAKGGEVDLEHGTTIRAHFHSRDHLDRMVKRVLDEQTRWYDDRYF